MMMNNKKTLILHGGYPKTGTTSIQWALDANRALLAEIGVLYPSSCDHAGDLLRRMVRQGYVKEPRQTGKEILAKEVANGLLQEFIDSSCKYAIVSDEALSNFSKTQWEILAGLFSSDLVNIRLVFTVREPYSHTVSVIQQILKVGEMSLDQLYKNPRFYELEDTLVKSSYAFPNSQITAVSFELMRDNRPSLLESLLEEIDVQLVVSSNEVCNFRRDSIKNPSLSQQGAWVLDALNQLDRPDSVCENKWRVLCNDLCREIRGSKFTVSTECAVLIIRHARREAEVLNSYFGKTLYDLDIYHLDKYTCTDSIDYESEFYASLAELFRWQIDREYESRNRHSSLQTRFQNKHKRLQRILNERDQVG